jgi:hypothetical protein
MRKATGFVLILVGVLAVVAAILVPTVVVHHYKKTPLDIDVTQVSSGTAQILDPKTFQVAKDVPVRSTRYVKTDRQASDGTYTTVDEKLCTVVVQGPTPPCLPETDPRYLATTTDRVTTDRRNAESASIARYKESINGQTEGVKHVGLTYKWPIGTEKQTYRYFFADLNKAFPATYQGTEKVAGLTTYKFVSRTGVQPYTVPTAQGPVPGTYEDVTTVWVEPDTGAIVDGTERQILKMTNPAAPTGPKILAIDLFLKFDKSAVNDAAGDAKDMRNLLKWGELWAPLLLGAVALVSFVAGFFLLRRRRPATGTDPRNAGPANAGGPAGTADSGSDAATAGSDSLAGHPAGVGASGQAGNSHT